MFEDCFFAELCIGVECIFYDRDSGCAGSL